MSRAHLPTGLPLAVAFVASLSVTACAFMGWAPEQPSTAGAAGGNGAEGPNEASGGEAKAAGGEAKPASERGGRPGGKASPSATADRDGDGILDARDKCPDAPEDKDGFEDDDGCPDADNDGDGVTDA